MFDAEMDPRISDGEALLRGCLDAPGEPGPLLVYADWLEEQGITAHASLVRRVALLFWEEGHAQRHPPLYLGPYPWLAKVCRWERQGAWFWKVLNGSKGRKGTNGTRGAARRNALECLLRHRWPASSCPCATITH
jgi:uncharacterized protein (TIGR02996 family)